MLQICASIPIPTFNSLYADALSAMTIPPGNITIPLLPAIPNPIYPGFNCTNLEIVQIVAQLQSFQLLTTLLSFLQPLVEFLDISLDSILPKIPGTNLTLLDLLALDPTKIYDTLSVIPLSILASFPGVPNPLTYSITAPSIDIITAIQGVINGYVNTVTNTVVSLINDVVNILDIGGLPTIPVVPSLESLQAIIIPPTLPIVDVTKLLNQFSLNDLLALIPIPGFPAFPLLPIPLVVSVDIPEINMMLGLNLFYTNLTMFPMTIIFNFIENVLSEFIGFSFPTVCISI